MYGEREKCTEHFVQEYLHEQNNGCTWLWCNVSTDMHRHMDFYELFLVSNGTYFHDYGGKTQRIGKNALFFLKPGESHRLKAEHPHCVHFTFVIRSQLMEQFMKENPEFDKRLTKKNCLSCQLSDSEFGYLFMLTTLLPRLSRWEEGSVSMLLYHMLLYLIQHNYENGENGKYVEDLIMKINDNTYLTYKLQDIYKQYPIAQCTLSAEFKKLTGMTVMQYQKKQKLIYATQLLLESKCKIIEIATKLNYDSISHFLYIFKKEYGMTPTEYRKQHGK